MFDISGGPGIGVMSGNRDNELAYSIRSLVSEGHLKYQFTGFKNKEKVTIVKNMEGPTSLLTTTIKGKLEDQLEDRLITMHPNASTEQTQNIIERTAELAAGDIEPVDEKTISAWKQFNQSLVPVEVVIPYSNDIASFVSRSGSLPISARRAFKRVLSAIKTIALLYQKQRCKDDLGRVIADISDYAIAVQFIGESFRESIGNGKRYTDGRIKIIDKHRMISSKDLAKLTGVSVAAISQWMKPMVEKGVLMWVDQADNTFAHVESLEKAKRTGKAFIKVANINCLPTAYQLTGDERWNKDGDLYQKYDFELERAVADDTASNDTDDISLESSEAQLSLFDMVSAANNQENDGGVKVLMQKVEVNNENDKIKMEITETDIETKTSELLNEFKTVLSSGKQDISDLSSKDLTNYQKSCEQNIEIHENGILTI